MRHCPLKCVNNLSKKSGNDKNRIFTGYQTFVTGEILVFHRCLYNKWRYPASRGFFSVVLGTLRSDDGDGNENATKQ